MNANVPTLAGRVAGPTSASLFAFLATLPGLGGRHRAAVEDLASRAMVRRVRRGESLWHAGQPPADIFVVRSGAVLLRQGSGEHIVTLDVCGRGAMLGLAGHTEAEAVVHEDAALLVIPRSEFETWMARNPTVVPAVLELVAEHGRRLATRLVLVSRHGSKGRLAMLLLDLGTRFGVRDSRGTILDVRLTHREMAELIGATRETVSVAIIELRDAGVIATESKRVVIVDELALRRIADG